MNIARECDQFFEKLLKTIHLTAKYSTISEFLFYKLSILSAKINLFSVTFFQVQKRKKISRHQLNKFALVSSNVPEPN